MGEFLLEGLAEVDAGNEILVRFDLDLDGILQVRATEQATGRQKQLTIDNAVSRFRAARGQKAAAQAAAETDAAPGGMGVAAAPADSLSAMTGQSLGTASPTEQLAADMSELLDRCQGLLAKGERLAGQTNPTDAAELRRLAAEVRQAVDRRSQGDIESTLAQFEDLVFYVEDA